MYNTHDLGFVAPDQQMV